MPQEINISNVPVECPECGRMTDSLKCYSVPDYILFIGIYVAWSFSKKVCCPHCMRKQILIKYFTYNIIIGNFVWLLVGLPMGICKMINSYTKGHSDSVKKILAQHIAEAEAQARQQYAQQYEPQNNQYNYHNPTAQ